MKYVSIDIETLGLDPDNHDIVEFGAVLDDLAVQRPLEDLPRFHAYILPPRDEGYRGDPFAMSMHSTILRRIAKLENDRRKVGDEGYRYLHPSELTGAFVTWCRQQGLGKPKPTKPGVTVMAAPSTKDIKFVPAGKNFAGFDKPFLLANIPGWKDLRVTHRVLDPGMLYFDPSEDLVPPNLHDCLVRAKVGRDECDVAHTAVEDSLSVIKVLRAKFPLTSVHKNMPEEMRHCPPGAKDNGLPFFDIWSEGYRATGDSGGAYRHGRMDGVDFKAACKRLAFIDEKFRANFDPEKMTFWGCRLYDSEAPARASFG